MTLPVLCLQLSGYGIMPFITEMQNLLLAALFRPLNQRLSITQCLVDHVSDLVLGWDPMHRKRALLYK